jgi:hypothetical protein
MDDIKFVDKMLVYPILVIMATLVVIAVMIVKGRNFAVGMWK